MKNRMDSTDKQEIMTALETTVRVVVNGNIRRVEQKLDSHIQNMEPLLDALRVVQSMQKFFKWLGLPLIVIIIPVWIWLKKNL
jgi:hypothetical protein